MPYLNLDLEWFGHRKAVRLVGLLGPGADLYPIKLWAYVGKHHAETGRLDGYTEQEIESICGWQGETGKLAQTFMLPQINLLEVHENCFEIHDWFEHSGHLAAFKKRAKSAAKKRWGRYASSNAKRKRKQYPSKRLGKVKIGKEKSGREEGLGEEKPLPEWLAPDLWERFREHRRKMKKPLTIYGEERALAKLGKLRDAGQNVEAVIEQSIDGPWLGLFEVKPNGMGGTGIPVKTEQQREKVKQMLEQKLT